MIHDPSQWRDAPFYNRMFIDKSNTNYHCKAEESGYYGVVWEPALRMMGSKPQDFVDLGCGPGQFIDLAQRHGHRCVYGMDFSAYAAGMAKKFAPVFVGDIFSHTHRVLRASQTVDTVVALELLEHLKDDMAFFELVHPGERVIASVPNFMCTGHVRAFDEFEEVFIRYCDVLEIQDSHVATWQEKKWFTIAGVRL